MKPKLSQFLTAAFVVLISSQVVNAQPALIGTGVGSCTRTGTVEPYSWDYLDGQAHQKAFIEAESFVTANEGPGVHPPGSVFYVVYYPFGHSEGRTFLTRTSTRKWEVYVKYPPGVPNPW